MSLVSTTKQSCVHLLRSLLMIGCSLTVSVLHRSLIKNGQRLPRTARSRDSLLCSTVLYLSSFYDQRLLLVASDKSLNYKCVLLFSRQLNVEFKWCRWQMDYTFKASLVQGQLMVLWPRLYNILLLRWTMWRKVVEKNLSMAQIKAANAGRAQTETACYMVKYVRTKRTVQNIKMLKC